MTKNPDRPSTGAAHGATPPDRPAGPFAALAALRDRLPAGVTASSGEPAAPRGPARAAVRYERKGRGGKEVTVVEQLGLPGAELDTWCRELKRALGCGGSIESGAIALAGDQRQRLPALLTARGVRRVSVS